MFAQLSFDYLFSQAPKETAACNHSGGFIANSMVPKGFVCLECEELIWRYLPPPKNQPQVLGYETGDWAWKYIYGNNWTNN